MAYCVRFLQHSVSETANQENSRHEIFWVPENVSQKGNQILLPIQNRVKEQPSVILERRLGISVG
jgi:hypothetical protein